MRTTIVLENDVLAKARAVAKRLKVPFRQVVNEALREGLRQKKTTFNEIQRFAQIDRVEKIMQPYLEALA